MLSFLAQATTYSFDYQTNTSTTTTSSTGVSATVLIISLIIGIIAIIGLWKVFTKAGQKGWKVLIPIYNIVILMRIVGYSGWMTLLFFVPFVNWIFGIVVAYRLAKSFGYGVGMTILLLLEIGYLILGFGNAKYVGPNGGPAAGAATPRTPTTPTPTSNPVPAS